MTPFSALLVIVILELCTTVPIPDYANINELLTNSTNIAEEEIELEETNSTVKFSMQESMTISQTNEEGVTTCLTYYRHVASDDHSHDGICTAGNCKDDPDIVECRTYFPEKFLKDYPNFL